MKAVRLLKRRESFNQPHDAATQKTRFPSSHSLGVPNRCSVHFRLLHVPHLLCPVGVQHTAY
jgi:hypothetical protein